RKVSLRRTVTSLRRTRSDSASWMRFPIDCSCSARRLCGASAACIAAAVARAVCPKVGMSSTCSMRGELIGVAADGPALESGVCIDGRSNEEPRSWVWPSWIGEMVRGAPPKADDSESASTRYLPSLSEEIAYMTTKKANRSVIRSAYGIAQASWFWCSSWRWRRPMRGASVDEAVEPRLDVARVLALGDRDQPFDDHLALLRLVADQALELARDRQQRQVGQADAVDRRGERGGDAVAELARVGEVLHDRHQAQHRADDAQRRRVDAHPLEHLGGGDVAVGLAVQLDLQHLPDRLGLDAVDHHLQALAQERILQRLHLRLQPEQALAAGGAAPLDDARDDRGAVLHRRLEYPAHDAQGALEGVHRRLHQDRRDGAEHHDHEGRRRPEA